MRSILKRIAVIAILGLAAATAGDVILLRTAGIGVTLNKARRPLTPLMTAATVGDSEVVLTALKAGAKINEQRGYSWRLEVCYVVRCTGEDLPFGQTALMQAIDSESVQAVSILLDHGARVDLRDSRGQSALDHAIATLQSPASKAILNLMLQRPDVADDSAVSHAIYQAVTMSRPDTIRLLLPLIRDKKSLVSSMCTAAHSTSTASIEMLELFGNILKPIPSELNKCMATSEAERYLLDHGLQPNAG